jgi:metal-responsive CopG/Arc/MetJ family transcriptional regulator
MSNSRTISLRIPDDLLSEIDRLAEERYKSHKGTPNRSLVILDAITAYCNTLSGSEEENSATLSHTVTIEQFQSLQEVVHSLADELKALKSSIDIVHDTVLLSGQVNEKGEENIRLVDGLEKMPIQLSVHETNTTIFNLEDLQGKPQISPIPSPVFATRLKSLSHLKRSSAGAQLSTIKGKMKESYWEWIAEQDPDKIKWQYQPKKGTQQCGYIPKGDLSEDQLNNLLKWIEDHPF